MEELTKRQRTVSELSALINRDNLTLARLRGQLSSFQSSVNEARLVVADLRDAGVVVSEEDESDPDRLLAEIESSIGRVDANFVTGDLTPDVTNQIIWFLKKKVRTDP
jgi:hypothetical protein